MGDKSGIEWTDSTWNPVTGCSKVSQACKHCYAERDWPRLVHLPAYKGRAFTDVACHPERLDQPLRWARPRKIFVNSVSDLFHEDVPFEFIDKVFAVMALAERHTFQVLTKRPARMLEYMTRLGKSAKILDDAARTLGYTLKFNGQYLVSWPLPNVWLGVSVEDQTAADERIPLLLKTPAAVRWLSMEPLLGPVDLVKAGALWSEAGNSDRLGRIINQREASAIYENDPLIDWVVAGGESGPKARPMHPEWARDLRDQCAAAGVPFLFKQWGAWAPNCLCDTQKPHKTTARPEPGKPGVMFLCGTKAAGRLLDGVPHDGYPKGK